MLQSLRNFIYKSIGLNRLRSEIETDLADIKTTLNTFQSQNRGVDYRLAEIDDLIQRRLDEKLSHYFHWKMALSFPDKGNIFIHTNDGHRLYVDPKEAFMTLHLLEHGEWETPIRRELRRELSPGSIFIDIGANIGLHTLLAAELVGERGRVFAVEPHPVTMEILRKNLEINSLLDRVGLAKLAISNVDDNIVTFEYFLEHPAMSGLKVSKEIIDKFNGTLERIDVKTITLDSLVRRNGLSPDLVKIDVEGFEYTVLEGCVETIATFPNVHFLMEYWKDMAESVMRPGIGLEIAKFFEDKGFKVSKVNEDNLSPMTYKQFTSDVGGDFFFAR